MKTLLSERLLRRLPAMFMVGAVALMMGLPIVMPSVPTHSTTVVAYDGDPGGDCCARADTVKPRK